MHKSCPRRQAREDGNWIEEKRRKMRTICQRYLCKLQIWRAVSWRARVCANISIVLLNCMQIPVLIAALANRVNCNPLSPLVLAIIIYCWRSRTHLVWASIMINPDGPSEEHFLVKTMFVIIYSLEMSSLQALLHLIRNRSCWQEEEEEEEEERRRIRKSLYFLTKIQLHLGFMARPL